MTYPEHIRCLNPLGVFFYYIDMAVFKLFAVSLFWLSFSYMKGLKAVDRGILGTKNTINSLLSVSGVIKRNYRFH